MKTLTLTWNVEIVSKKIEAVKAGPSYFTFKTCPVECDKR